MKTLLKAAYLPLGSVTDVLAGKGAAGFAPILESLGVELHYTEPMSALHPPMCDHADCAVFPLDGRSFVLEQGQNSLKNFLTSCGADVRFAAQPLTNGYPAEAALNALSFRHTLLCNSKNTDFSVLRLAKSEKYDIIHCKQGYTKCSVAPVREDAVLTDDVGIANLLSDTCDVLLVEKGDIQLRKYPYGFIGGACGLLSASCMFFFGNAGAHRDFDKIKSFLRNHNVYSEFPKSLPLQDIGSIIPILERREKL